MPGTALNLDLPDLSEDLSTIVAKIVTALSAISDDLTPKIVASEININAGLSFNGNALTGLGSTTLVSGNVPTSPGSIYYSGGEFYVIDATGPIKLTQLGNIAVAGVKGIGGDYGNVGNSALVYFDNLSGEYRFFDGTGTAHAPLVTKYLTVYNAADSHYVRQRASASATGDYDVTWPVAQPGTANSVMIFSAANPTVAQFQDPATFVRTTSGVPGYRVGNQITKVLPGSMAMPTTGTTPWQYAGASINTTAATAGVDFPIDLPVGAILTAWNTYWVKNSTSGTLIANATGIDSTNTGSGITGSGAQSNSAASPGAIQLGVSGLSFTATLGKSYYIGCSKTTAITGDVLIMATYTYYIP